MSSKLKLLPLLDLNVYQAAFINSKVLPPGFRLVCEEEVVSRLQKLSGKNKKKKGSHLSGGSGTSQSKSNKNDPSYKGKGVTVTSGTASAQGKVSANKGKIKKQESEHSQQEEEEEEDYLVESSDSNKDSDPDFKRKQSKQNPVKKQPPPILKQPQELAKNQQAKPNASYQPQLPTDTNKQCQLMLSFLIKYDQSQQVPGLVEQLQIILQRLRSFSYNSVASLRNEVETLFQKTFNQLNDKPEILAKARNTHLQYENLIVDIDNQGCMRDYQPGGVLQQQTQSMPPAQNGLKNEPQQMNRPLPNRQGQQRVEYPLTKDERDKVTQLIGKMVPEQLMPIAAIVRDAKGVQLQGQSMEFKIEDLPAHKQRELQHYVYKTLNMTVPRRRPVPNSKQNQLQPRQLDTLPVNSGIFDRALSSASSQSRTQPNMALGMVSPPAMAQLARPQPQSNQVLSDSESSSSSSDSSLDDEPQRRVPRPGGLDINQLWKQQTAQRQIPPITNPPTSLAPSKS